MSAETASAETKEKEFQRKKGQLTRDFVEAYIARGIEDFKRGFNVYFRHFPNERTLPRDDLPANDEE